MTTYAQKYPIGQFVKPTEITQPLLTEWITIISALPQDLRKEIETLSDQQLDTPYRDGGWTVRQVVHHYADSHMNAFCRFKLALTEDNPRLKLFLTIASTSITQEVIAGFLETGRYENHLRKLRHTLHANFLKYSRAIADYFPEGTLASRPQEGFVVWAELPGNIDTIDLYEKALRQKISFAPGRIFTLQNQYANCLRLNYGLLWNDQLEKSLQALGHLAKAEL
jgi:hypothetical protein